MERKYCFLIAILIVFIITFIFFCNNPKPTYHTQYAHLNQKCSDKGDYCIYNNIPSYLDYTSPDENLPENYSLTEEEILDKYFKTSLEDSKNNSFSFLKPEEYRCSNGKKILLVNYFYKICNEKENCTHEREAFICGDIYFIQDSLSDGDKKIYGPFSIKKR